MTDHVYLGPSLAQDEATRLLPEAVFRPPVAHGDLLRDDFAPGDRVLIVDGLFMHAPPVRHREILDLLQRGVVVAGAASMGALRAAELHTFGMRGVGTVFELYRSGEVTGDDEVAVVHGPAEEGYRALSEPLVNIRVALRAASLAGAVDPAEAERLLSIAGGLPFRRRGYRALTGAATSTGDRAAVDRFLAWHKDHPVNAKEDDARRLLALAATGPAALAPHGSADMPIENVTTEYFLSWRARQRGWPVRGQWVTEAEVAAALAVLHPDQPRLHRRDVLRRLVGDPPGPDQPELERRAVALARGWGLHPDDGEGWFTDAERAGTTADEATLRHLVRVFGTVHHRQLSLAHLPPELATEPLLNQARQIVAAARALTGGLPRSAGGTGRLRLRPTAVLDCFARLWGCPPDALLAAVRDRGLTDLDHFWLAAEPFVLYCRSFGAPDFAAVPTRPAYV